MNLNFEILGVLFVVIGQAMFLAYKLGRIEEKLNMLEHKQDKHNGVIERMVKAESNIKAIWKKLEY